MAGSQDDKAVFRKANSPQNTRSSYVGKNANPIPKKFSASTTKTRKKKVSKKSY
jgi:hypothetical protein